MTKYSSDLVTGRLGVDINIDNVCVYVYMCGKREEGGRKQA